MRKLMMICDWSFNITTNSDTLEGEMHGYQQRLVTTIKEELNGGLISLKFDLAAIYPLSVSPFSTFVIGRLL